MTTGLELILFVAATAASLFASNALISGIEGLASHFSCSEATLGLLAAFAADAPEITSAVTALSRHQAAVGAGVVVGSNVFNLAALLGLGAIVAGSVALHRRVVALAGGVALVMAIVCLVVLSGTISPAVGLGITAVLLVTYVLLAALPPERIAQLSLPERWRRWLADAMQEEDFELEALQLRTRRPRHHLVVALSALVSVIGASVVMERSATAFGDRAHIPGIVIGAVVLAAVTSLPNAVAAVYLAQRGRGIAVLSTAFNSNGINVVIGLLLPATLTGLHGAVGQRSFVAAWYLALTLFCVACAWRAGALRRWFGWTIVAAYGVFVVLLILISGS